MRWSSKSALERAALLLNFYTSMLYKAVVAWMTFGMCLKWFATTACDLDIIDAMHNVCWLHTLLDRARESQDVPLEVAEHSDGENGRHLLRKELRLSSPTSSATPRTISRVNA